jgi:hypothetical protein
MPALHTIIHVDADGAISGHAPARVPPGDHAATIAVADGSAESSEDLDLPLIDVGPWPENLSLRRKDLYGDEGR